MYENKFNNTELKKTSLKFYNWLISEKKCLGGFTRKKDCALKKRYDFWVFTKHIKIKTRRKAEKTFRKIDKKKRFWKKIYIFFGYEKTVINKSVYYKEHIKSWEKYFIVMNADRPVSSFVTELRPRIGFSLLFLLAD